DHREQVHGAQPQAAVSNLAHLPGEPPHPDGLDRLLLPSGRDSSCGRHFPLTNSHVTCCATAMLSSALTHYKKAPPTRMSHGRLAACAPLRFRGAPLRSGGEGG